MHAYGTTQGNVALDLTREGGLQHFISTAHARQLQEQLAVAIREAELKQIRQLSLVFPGEDAA